MQKKITIICNSVVAFHDVSRQVIEDVTNSLLFSYYASNEAKEDKPKQKILEALGWIVQEIKHSGYINSAQFFKKINFDFDLMRESQSIISRDTLAEELFYKKSNLNMPKCFFSLINVTTSKNNDTVITMSCYKFLHNNKFFVSNMGNIHHENYIYTLNENGYSQIRHSVIEKLQDMPKSEVKLIPKM